MASRLPGETVAEKLALNVQRSGECLRWTGAHTPKGYGQIYVEGRVRPVHVVAHEIGIGPVPGGYEVDHVRSRGCTYRDCVEILHLEAVTRLENVRRAAMAARTHCDNGHEFSPENTHLRPGGMRQCRVCRRARNSAYRKRRRQRDGSRG